MHQNQWESMAHQNETTTCSCCFTIHILQEASARHAINVHWHNHKLESRFIVTKKSCNKYPSENTNREHNPWKIFPYFYLVKLLATSIDSLAVRHCFRQILYRGTGQQDNLSGNNSSSKMCIAGCFLTCLTTFSYTSHSYVSFHPDEENHCKHNLWKIFPYFRLVKPTDHSP